MSLLDHHPSSREGRLSSEAAAAAVEKKASRYLEAVPRSSQSSCYSTPNMRFDDADDDDADNADITSFYGDMDDADVVIASPSKEQPDMEVVVPALPPKNALRASRMLDGFNLGLPPTPKAAAEPKELSQSTPHDFYLSSEEDASSSADDFSDYDWDSAAEEEDAATTTNTSTESPPRRRSHEDTARVVSVVFAGKPSLIDLSSIRRSMSPSSINARRHAHQNTSSTDISIASSASLASQQRRPQTSSSTIQSQNGDSGSPLPPRKSSMITAILSKPKHSFLHIDPYANGSVYSLDMNAGSGAAEEGIEDDRQSVASSARPQKAAAAATNNLLRGVSRTFSLVKKRSSPLLRNLAGSSSQEQQQQQSSNGDDAASIMSVQTRDDEQATPTPTPAPAAAEKEAEPSAPVTYGEIIRAARNNARAQTLPPAEPQQTSFLLPQSPQSPMSPNSVKGFLGNLASRRKSLKGGARLH